MEDILKQILTELGSLRQGQERLEKGQERLGKGQDILAEGQLKLETRMSKLETRMNKLEIKMENEVIDKIKVLNDARQVDHEAIIRIESKLDGIIKKVDVHEVEINSLKKVIGLTEHF